MLFQIKNIFAWVILMTANYAFSQSFMEMFEFDKIKIITISAGVNGATINNKLLNGYIDNYNKVNKNNLSDNFNHFKMMGGYEIGARWTLLDVQIGQLNSVRQIRNISPITERVMDLKINYVSVLAAFPVAKGKMYFSMGLQTIRSIYSLYLRYNNGEISYGRESGLNGNYKGLGMNSALRLEGFIIKNENSSLGIYGHYTGAIAGAGGIFTDNNAAKGAFNLTNATTSTDVKTNFGGFILGLNFHYTLGQ